MKRSLIRTTQCRLARVIAPMLLLLLLPVTQLLRAQPQEMKGTLLNNDSTATATANGKFLKRIHLYGRGQTEWGVMLAEDSLSIHLLNDEGEIRNIPRADVERMEGYPERTTLVLYTRDGSEVMGSIVDAGMSSIRFRTGGGIDMTILPTYVARIEQTHRTVSNGKYQRFDPNRTRLFFAPTGRALNAGEGYFSVAELVLPFAAVGITDWLAIGGGMSLVPGAESQLMYGTLKATPIRGDQGGVSVGLLYLGLPSEGIDGTAIAYAVGTVGNNDNAFIFGLGESISGEGTGGSPVLMIGGELRASNSLKFITENWIPTSGGGGLLMFGIRVFGDNISADFGMMTTTSGIGGGGFPFIPWLGFGYNFGS